MRTPVSIHGHVSKGSSLPLGCSPSAHGTPLNFLGDDDDDDDDEEDEDDGVSNGTCVLCAKFARVGATDPDDHDRELHGLVEVPACLAPHHKERGDGAPQVHLLEVSEYVPRASLELEYLTASEVQLPVVSSPSSKST